MKIRQIALQASLSEDMKVKRSVENADYIDLYKNLIEVNTKESKIHNADCIEMDENK